jgi:hypothetical protein
VRSMPACIWAVAGKVRPAVRAVMQAAVATSRFYAPCFRAAARALWWLRARVRPHKMSGRWPSFSRVGQVWVVARSDAPRVCMCARGLRILSRWRWLQTACIRPRQRDGSQKTMRPCAGASAAAELGASLSFHGMRSRSSALSECRGSSSRLRGDGGDGHLGLDDVLHQQQPARAGGEMSDNQRIRLTAAGRFHLAVMAEDGAVYTCGNGANGQLGSATGSRGGS